MSFDDAARVLADESGDRTHVEELDDEHGEDEERWITTASHPDDRRIVLRIVWIDRTRHGERVTRIVSARPATKRERRSYGHEIGEA